MEKPDLNKPAFLFLTKEKNRIERGLCPTCEKKVKEEEFKDELSKKEYSINGMCQECQDNTFKGYK